MALPSTPVRALQALVLFLAIYFAVKRVHRSWKDRLALAELLVGIGEEEEEEEEGGIGENAQGQQKCGRKRSKHKLFRELPEPLIAELAMSYAAAFANNPMYKYLYRGPSRWRKRVLAQLFTVHARIANEHLRTRFFVDPKTRIGSSSLSSSSSSTQASTSSQHYASASKRAPKPLCFASVYEAAAPQPGLVDVINAGGLTTFVELGVKSFLRSYAVEQSLNELRVSMAPRKGYYCLDHLFVTPKQQCTGIGSEMLQALSESADPLMVTITDCEAIDFFAKHGFRLLCQETYHGTSSVTDNGGDEEQGGENDVEQEDNEFTVWIMWRERTAV